MKEKSNVLFTADISKLIRELTPAEIGVILCNKSFVENSRHFTVTFETGKQISGAEYCALFEYYTNKLATKTISKAPWPAPEDIIRRAGDSQLRYEEKYWDYVNCPTNANVTEPEDRLKAMLETITSEIHHVVDKPRKKPSNAPVWAMATFLMLATIGVLSLIHLIT